MIWLPELAETGTLPRLPLSQGAGPALVLLLTGEPGQETEAAARAALERDPAIALWTVLRAWRAGQSDLRTMDALAQWLTAHADDALAWPAAPDATPADEKWLGVYQRLFAESLTVARRAHDLAVETNPIQADEAYLLGLLHAASRWFALDPAWPQSADERQLPGPAWLSVATGQRTERPPQDRGSAYYVEHALNAMEGEAPSEGVAAGQRDEAIALAGLSHSLPRIAAKLSRSAGLEREFVGRLTNAKLEAMAEFAAGAGHEINNPIAVIAGRAQLLVDGEPLPERRRELAIINTQAMRVYEMIADMMLFAQPPAPQKAICDLSQLVDRVVAELAAAAHEKKVTFDCQSNGAPVSAAVDANQMVMALKAICQNALDAVGSGGRVTVFLEPGTAGGVAFRVADNGPGLSPEALEHLFDPFYCGRAAGRRLGMGLAKAWRIVRNHGGEIAAENRSTAGALFTIILPAAAPNS